MEKGSIMKGAMYGFYSLSLLLMNGIFIGLELWGRFPYFRTPLYPLVLLIAGLIALVGVVEYDRQKFPAGFALVMSTGLLLHWIVMLIIRLV
jgi:hypothetical protein